MPLFQTPRRIAFFHLPKCAGTTLTVELRQGLRVRKRKRHYVSGYGSVWLNDVVPGQDRLARAKRARDARFVYGHFHRGTYRLIRPRASDFTIAFLRNPVDRLLSLYRWERWFAIQNAQDLMGDPRTTMLSHFLCDPDPMRRMTTNNGMTRLLGASSLKEPKSNAEWSRVLDRAIETLEQLSFVGLVEDYNRDADDLFRRLEIQRPDLHVPMNVTPDQARTDAAELDDRAISAVAQEIFEACNAYDTILYRHAQQLTRGFALAAE